MKNKQNALVLPLYVFMQVFMVFLKNYYIVLCNASVYVNVNLKKIRHTDIASIDSTMFLFTDISDKVGNSERKENPEFPYS